MSSRTGIYAILDVVAKGFLGGLQLHKHDASAVRTFIDLLADDKTVLGKHPEDYELVSLGSLGDPSELDEGDELVAVGFRKVLTGVQWQNMRDGSVPLKAVG